MSTNEINLLKAERGAFTGATAIDFELENYKKSIAYNEHHCKILQSAIDATDRTLADEALHINDKKRNELSVDRERLVGFLNQSLNERKELEERFGLVISPN